MTRSRITPGPDAGSRATTAGDSLDRHGAGAVRADRRRFVAHAGVLAASPLPGEPAIAQASPARAVGADASPLLGPLAERMRDLGASDPVALGTMQGFPPPPARPIAPGPLPPLPRPEFEARWIPAIAAAVADAVERARG